MPELTISQFADRVGELMPVIMKEFMKHQVEEFYKLKITMPQFFVLEILSRLGESKMSDLAKYMNVSTAAMTGVVDRLVRDGYVTRSHDVKDRRIVRISLTGKGAKMTKQMMDRRNDISKKIFGMISQREREQYLSILEHIKENLQD